MYKIILLAIGSVITLAVGMPFLVIKIYNIIGCQMHFNVADLLSYYGTVSGSIVAIVALCLTIMNENKKLRDENSKREIERKKESVVQRVNYISNNLRHMLSKLDGSSLLNRFNGEIDLWINDPMALYKFFDEAHNVINIDINFSNYEKNLIASEFEELQKYAIEYSALLWELYCLLLERKRTKQMRKTNYEMIQNLTERIKARMNQIQQDDSSIIDILETAYDNSEKYQKELKVNFEQVIANYESIKKLFSEKYQGLIVIMQNAISKLEQQID